MEDQIGEGRREGQRETAWGEMTGIF